MNRWILLLRRMSRQLWWRASLYAALGVVGTFLYAIVGVTAINAQYYGPGGWAIIFLFSLVVVALTALTSQTTRPRMGAAF